jgi:hypothetical protein
MFLMKGPFLEESGIDPHLLDILLHEMDDLLLKEPSVEEEHQAKPRRKKPLKEPS